MDECKIEYGWVKDVITNRFNTSNTSSRGGFNVDWITIHYTAGTSTIGAASWLCDKRAKASAHFVIGQEGETFQLASMSTRTWHVGRGAFETNGKRVTSRCDRGAIGIELTNPGPVEWDAEGENWVYHVGRVERTYDHLKYGSPVYLVQKFENGLINPSHWAPYPDAQLEKLVWLCSGIVKEYGIDVTRIIGHESAAHPQGRKTDPGPAFPWARFYDELCSNLGIDVPSDLDKNHKVSWR